MATGALASGGGARGFDPQAADRQPLSRSRPGAGPGVHRVLRRHHRGTRLLRSTPDPTREGRQEDASTRKQHECDAENETSAPGPGALIGLGWSGVEWSGVGEGQQRKRAVDGGEADSSRSGMGRLHP
jgi:hypothetical protein